MGVDVGGTFTKAVACVPATAEVVARAIVPTTHHSELGVAEGVVQALSDVVAQVEVAGVGPVELVAHSTTQAVNALLEGDTAKVGVLGIGRRPDLKRARKRTQVGAIRLAPGRCLETLHSFIDSTDGVDREALRVALERLKAGGAGAACISEAFGVESSDAEKTALEVAKEIDLPACAGHELSGLYGLEMRTVTGALNASILPTALRTARVVRDAIERDVPGVPLLVMRGDGGAVDLTSMERHPLLTAFSGPAASVAGALRNLDIADSIVIEVGGTSTNVSAVKGGRPVLAYVRVLDHMTCVRSLDVRVVGIAGGSLFRIGRRLGRMRIEDVGPRSAHIAGLVYCCFAEASELEGARAELVAPKQGDPVEYATVVTRRGKRLALTLTCAANALEQVPNGAYARGDKAAALAGFQALARLVGTDALSLARRVMSLAGDRVAGVVADVTSEHGLETPSIVGVGGGVGALVPSLGTSLGRDWRIPPDAEVISSIGDALSLVRVEIERIVGRDPKSIAAIHHEAESLAIAAGAAPSSLQVESSAVPERHALRIVAIGSVALESDAGGQPAAVDDETLRLVAKRTLGGEAELYARNDFYSVFAAAGEPRRRYVVVDRHGSLALQGEGLLLSGGGGSIAAQLDERVPALTRHIGPMAVAPAVRLLRGTRLVDLTGLSGADAVLEAAHSECLLANGDPLVVFLSRQ